MNPVIDLTGKTFSRLYVLSIYGSKNKRVYWECLCSCGKNKIVLGQNLKNGHTKSCGCYNLDVRSKAMITHGCSKGRKMTPLKQATYYSWQNMKRRCLKNSPESKYHGDKGITICERWQYSFESFLQDMGTKPSIEYTIDRYPNKNGNYEPSNCRWATHLQQSGNLNSNRWIKYNGTELILADWARYFKVTPSNLTNMLKVKSFNELFIYYTNKNLYGLESI